MSRRTLLDYVCSWCGSVYAHAWTDWRGEPAQDSHGVCARCALVVLREAERDACARTN